jgi:tetratricopeptide (TPR) repeat protein
MGALLLCLLLGTPQARALPACPRLTQNSPEARKAAGKWWTYGVKFFDTKAYKTAITAWQCAYRLAPHPLALYNIARAADRSGDYALAIKNYKRFLVEQPNAPNRAHVEQTIRSLEAKRKARPRVTQGPTGPQPAPHRRSRPNRVMGFAGWATLGLGVALGALAGAFGGLAVKAKATVEDAEFGTPWGSELQGPYDNYTNYRIGAYVCAGLAGAAVIAGVTLLVLSRRGRRVERATVAPALLPGGAGLSIQARF